MSGRILLFGLALAALAGCAGADPYRRAGQWQPEGVNAGNMAAMVENPFDLVRGRGDARPERKSGSDAVGRLWDHHGSLPYAPDSAAQSTAQAPADAPAARPAGS